MTIKKSFTNLEVLNIVGYVNKAFTPEQAKALPTKFRWNLKKNLDKLIPIAKNYEDFQRDMIEEYRQIWFDEEHSEEFVQDITDADGNPMLDENGEQQTETRRRIKSEYMEESQKAAELLDSKLREIQLETNIVEMTCVDLDAFVDSLPDDSPIDFDCLNILCFMDETTNVLKEAE